jgi:hypothetical protein
MEKQILAYVSEYVNEHGRGCPKGVLVHVAGFKAKDVAALIDSGAVETGRGNEGGLYPRGGKPQPKTEGGESLKARAFDYLRTIDTDTARQLVEEYEAQNAARRKD